jgi:hypothetical protein
MHYTRIYRITCKAHAAAAAAKGRVQ